MLAKFNAKIAGTGRSLPEKVLNNFDLEKILDTSDEWIKTRTGMFERHIAEKDEVASDFAYEACLKALDTAQIKPKDIDLIIVGTITGDYVFPSTACVLQKRLGIRGFPAFDVSAGCSGFIYALSVGAQFIESGFSRNALVVGVEMLSKITNWNDRNTAVLFGDGAGAVVLSKAEPTDISKLIDIDLSADGTYGDYLVQKAGGSRMPACIESVEQNLHTVYMEGNKIFKLAVKSMQHSCETILKKNNIDIKAIDWLIPHQANMRIIESLGNKLKIDENKVVVGIEKYANTSAATIPIVFDEAIRSKKINRGDLILLTAFGAGLTSGSILLRY